VWKSLAEDVPAASPWVRLLREQIARAAGELGIDAPAISRAPEGAPGAAPRGPSSADVEAAQEMTPEDRMAFIRSMVEQLAARLDSQPADPDGWLRLARAYDVLGEGDKARAALASAEAVIAALPEAAPERAALVQRLETLRQSLP
jgi:cytochrome c-type biogenesis protein CcmH